MTDKLGIMTVGINGVGKSTFAMRTRDRLRAIDHLVAIIDRDRIMRCLSEPGADLTSREQYSSSLITSIRKKAGNLRLYAELEANNKHIILPNCNLDKNPRKQTLSSLKRKDYHTVLVDFPVNLQDTEQLGEYVHTLEQRDEETRSGSTQFELAEAMITEYERNTPEVSEADSYFQINSHEDTDKIVNSIMQLLHTKN